MNKVKFKLIDLGFCFGAFLFLFGNSEAFVIGRSVSLSFERCSPYDTVFELNNISIDTCTSNPCRIPIGKEVLISGSFNYKGDNMETDLKLNHRPNWLLNYVYTPATVVKKDNKFTAKDQFYFQATVHVDESLAPLKGTLNWRLYDVDENKIACYNIPVELTLF